MSDSLTEVHQALLQADRFAELGRDDYEVTRLGGLTNRVYKIETAAEKLVLRLPGQGTEAYIDRRVEAVNARVAAKAGVSPEVLFIDPSSGVMITRCIDNSVTMSPDLFKQRDRSPDRAGRALRQLHASGLEFEFRFELFQMIDEYLKLLSDKDAALPEGYHQVVEAAQPVKIALAENPVELAPCHNDPLCENFLDDGDRMWIVDWEYSGMNDPLWDLGDLSVEAGFDEQQDWQMMRAYCGGEPDDAFVGRVIIYKSMCDLLWTLWGLIQHTDDNPAEDFWAYATGRFKRCKDLMTDSDFERHLRAIRAQTG